MRTTQVLRLSSWGDGDSFLMRKDYINVLEQETEYVELKVLVKH